MLEPAQGRVISIHGVPVWKKIIDIKRGLLGATLHDPLTLHRLCAWQRLRTRHWLCTRHLLNTTGLRKICRRHPSESSSLGAVVGRGSNCKCHNGKNVMDGQVVGY